MNFDGLDPFDGSDPRARLADEEALHRATSNKLFGLPQLPVEELKEEVLVDRIREESEHMTPPAWRFGPKKLL